MKKHLIFIFLLYFLFGVQSAQAASYALVVGNGQYQHLRILKNPKNDAERIAGHMQDFGYQLIGGSVLYDLKFPNFFQSSILLYANISKY